MLGYSTQNACLSVAIASSGCCSTSLPTFLMRSAAITTKATRRPQTAYLMEHEIIPPNINQLSLEEHLLLYVRLGLRIQPCYPWDADCVDPGKQPRWTLEHRVRASPSEIIRHFREYPTDNLGLVPSVPNIGLDLDDPDPAVGGIRKVRTLIPEFSITRL